MDLRFTPPKKLVKFIVNNNGGKMYAPQLCYELMCLGYPALNAQLGIQRAMASDGPITLLYDMRLGLK